MQGSACVLVADDPSGTLENLLEPVEHDGELEVVVVRSGAQALKVLESREVQLVIANEAGAGIDALRLLENVRDQWPDTRRVLSLQRAPDPLTLIDAVNRAGTERILFASSDDEMRAQIGELLDSCLGAVASSRVSRPSNATLLRVELLIRQLPVRAALRRHLAEGGGFVAKPVSEISGHDGKVKVIVVELEADADIDGTLRQIRERDLYAPIVVVVSRANVALAHNAMEAGAHRYLVQPVDPATLRRVVRSAGLFARVAQEQRATRPKSIDPGDRTALGVRFERALDQLFIAFQPIVSCSQRRVFGVEALMRSESSDLSRPLEILSAAERLGRMTELGRRARACAIEDFVKLEPAVLFLNLHVSDVRSDDLLTEPLVTYADHIVLEITERAALDSVPDLGARLASLQEAGYRIAIDDLGAGYSGLSAFATLNPNVAKLDMSLVRDIDRSPTKRRLVRSLQDVCRDLGIAMVAEGIETVEERNTLRDLGADLMQGYLFARPSRNATVTWD